MRNGQTPTNPFEIPLQADEGSEDDTYATWKEARKIVALVGSTPCFITATTHFLLKDVERGDSEFSSESMSCLLQLLKSPSFKSATYYSAKSFHQRELEGKQILDHRTLVRIFRPSEMASLTSLLYLYRRIRKGCDRELFDRYAQELHPEAELAGLIGKSMKSIGLGFAEMSVYLPFLGQMMLLGIDKNKFQKYQTHCKVSQIKFDLAWEEQHFGCNHLQIGLLLIQAVGFGKKLFEPFMQGFLSSELDGIQPDSQVYQLRLIRLWGEALRLTHEPPDMVHRGEYYPTKLDLVHLADASRELSNEQNTLRWITRGKYDIGPNLTPELFHETDSHNEDERAPLADKLEQELLDELDSAGLNF